MTDENPLKTHCLSELEAQLNRNLFETERETLDVICNLLPLYYHSRTGEPLYPEANVAVALSCKTFTLTWTLPSIAYNSFSINFGDYTITNYVIKLPHETKEVYQKSHLYYIEPDKIKELEPAFLSGLYKAYTDFFLDPDYESKPQRNHHK
jgi:hypothetical protein